MDADEKEAQIKKMILGTLKIYKLALPFLFPKWKPGLRKDHGT